MECKKKYNKFVLENNKKIYIKNIKYVNLKKKIFLERQI